MEGENSYSKFVDIALIPIILLIGDKSSLSVFTMNVLGIEPGVYDISTFEYVGEKPRLL